MGKKRSRQYLLVNEAAYKKRNKKHHEQNLISSDMSNKILGEALIQQKEEEAAERNHNTLFFPEKPAVRNQDYDVDDSCECLYGFSQDQTQSCFYEEGIDEEAEKQFEALISNGPQQKLGNLILKKIKEKDAQPSSEKQLTPELDDSVTDMYKGVGWVLNKYTSGRIPNAFKNIPHLHRWEEILYLTAPEKWSPEAVLKATQIFASNFKEKKAARFYKFFLLPWVRDDIRKNGKLHSAVYKAVKKSLYKRAAFFKGILFPLCESRTCNNREAEIVGSIIKKARLSSRNGNHCGVAILTLAEMEYSGPISYFIMLLIEKCASEYRVLDALVSHFMKFCEHERKMPVIWHCSLLLFVQRYKNDLTKEDKVRLNILVQNQSHRKVTPEILRELNNSCNRGEKDNDLVTIASSTSVVYKTTEEDRRAIPDVPIEDD